MVVNKKNVQTTQAFQVANQPSPQIFIAHCSLSKKLLKKIENIIKNEKVKPYIANHEIYGTNISEKIIRAITDSDTLFAILTRKAFKKQITRDWIFFEIGLATGMWKKLISKRSSQHKIFVWKDEKIRFTNNSPIKMLTEHKTLQIKSKKSRDLMLEEMKSITQKISNIKSYKI